MQCSDTTAVDATAFENGEQKSSRTVDNSLTSLNWLPEFKIAAMDDRKDVAAACNAKDLPPGYSSTSDGASSTDSVTQESEPEKEECLLPLSPIKRCLNQTAEFDKNPSRFEENPNKPPFSYTTIIYLAIRSCNKDKVMLGDIYQWIKDHFKYYRMAESTWQNSVRHNLSLNQFFRKIPRSEGDPGKGSFWHINPEYEHLLNNDDELQRLVRQQNCAKTPLQRKRSKTRKKSLLGSLMKASSNSNSSGSNYSTTSCRRHGYTTGEGTFSPSFSMMSMDPCHVPGGDLDWVTLLSSQRLGCVSCSCHHCRQGETGVHVGGRGEPPPSLIFPLNKISDTPTFPSSRVLRNSLDDIITTQESPAPLLPPWTGESRPYSPTLEHPWAESHGHSPFMRRAGHCSPVPEVMWSTSGSNNVQHTPGKLRIAQLI